ncbi:MAG: histidinol-phosphatase [Treponema sp.]|nr:histidinol-phosphatase [Treponema sp.]MCL2272636.1 histidinol-phosphatase [Treponema sp.]
MKNEHFLTSMHTHTNFCDGQDDIETMCAAAYEKKLLTIGFSSHAPITKKTGIKGDWLMKDNLIYEYVDQVLAARKRWKGKLEVLLGFEIDYIKGLRSALDIDIKSLNPDFLIGSVHFIIPANGAQPFTVDGPMGEFSAGLNDGFNGDGNALMNCYYDALAEMITLGGFEILGHADIIKKNCLTDGTQSNLWLAENEAHRQAEISHIAAEKHIIAEINTGGINRGKINDVYPSLTFLRLFKEKNVPVIITSDAHRAEDLCGNYEYALKTLNNAGIKNHVIITGMNKQKIIWHLKELL